MAPNLVTYSPNISIYLKISGNRIRLADLLYNTATLYDELEAAPGTKATLVIVVENKESSTEVILENGATRNSQLLEFQYLDQSTDRWVSSQVPEYAPNDLKFDS